MHAVLRAKKVRIGSFEVHRIFGWRFPLQPHTHSLVPLKSKPQEHDHIEKTPIYARKKAPPLLQMAHARSHAHCLWHRHCLDDLWLVLLSWWWPRRHLSYCLSAAVACLLHKHTGMSNWLSTRTHRRPCWARINGASHESDCACAPQHDTLFDSLVSVGGVLLPDLAAIGNQRRTQQLKAYANVNALPRSSLCDGCGSELQGTEGGWSQRGCKEKSHSSTILAIWEHRPIPAPVRQDEGHFCKVVS